MIIILIMNSCYVVGFYGYSWIKSNICDNLAKSDMLLDTMAVNQAHATANRNSGDMWPGVAHNTHGK